MPELENHRPDDLTAQGLDLAASLVRDLFVDFFGSLVPGFLFTMITVPMIVWTGATLLGKTPGSGPDKSWVSAIPNSVLFTLLIVVSYVVGHMFSRRDPKVPDQKSLAYILRTNWDDLSRSVVQPKAADRDRFQVESGRGVAARIRSWFEIRRKARELAEGAGGQFPYSHLRTYLSKRGLDHLARHVPWDGDSEQIDQRSKLFINLLKIRIQFRSPRKCGDIVRNEAHVRMMSSVWFAAQLLQYVWVVLLAIVMASAYHRQQWSPIFKFSQGFPSSIVMVLVTLLICVTVLRRAIIYFLHYQRVREIVYVLATAHASLLDGNLKIFQGFDDGAAVREGLLPNRRPPPEGAVGITSNGDRSSPAATPEGVSP